MMTFLSKIFISVASAQEITSPVAPITGNRISVEQLTQIVNQVARFLISVAPVIAVIFIVWGGITYMAAGPDEEKAKNARTRIKNAIIGAIVVFGVGVILSTLTNFINTLTVYK